MTKSIRFNSPIGPIEITSSSNGVCQVYLFGTSALLPENESTSGILADAKRQVIEYLIQKRTQFTLPIDMKGINGFHRDSLIITQNIAFGNTITYGQLAMMLGKPSASRAVGGAMARNPLPILIPCHRVVAADGKLTGYSGADGINTKKWLLELEGHRIVSQKLV
jgi:methylated-DNA-[protein]-cysteine S-methyltransferase